MVPANLGLSIPAMVSEIGEAWMGDHDVGDELVAGGRVLEVDVAACSVGGRAVLQLVKANVLQERLEASGIR